MVGSVRSLVFFEVGNGIRALERRSRLRDGRVEVETTESLFDQPLAIAFFKAICSCLRFSPLEAGAR